MAATVRVQGVQRAQVRACRGHGCGALSCGSGHDSPLRHDEAPDRAPARSPLLTWFARPTVTIDGVGHPAQWGTGTWAVADDGDTVIGVYLYNRAWRFGAASTTVGDAEVLEYRAGASPVGGGRLAPVPGLPGRDSR